MPELLPTIGRIVQFKKRTGEIFPAIISKVNPAITPADEITVALTIFEEFSTVTRSYVPRGDGFDHWDWLDYTKQQAK